MRSRVSRSLRRAPQTLRWTRVESFEDHLAATEVMWEAFETPAERRDSGAHLRSEFEAARDAGVPVTFLAVISGRPPA